MSSVNNSYTPNASAAVPAARHPDESSAKRRKLTEVTEQKIAVVTQEILVEEEPQNFGKKLLKTLHNRVQDLKTLLENPASYLSGGQLSNDVSQKVGVLFNSIKRDIEYIKSFPQTDRDIWFGKNEIESMSFSNFSTLQMDVAKMHQNPNFSDLIIKTPEKTFFVSSSLLKNSIPGIFNYLKDTDSTEKKFPVFTLETIDSLTFSRIEEFIYKNNVKDTPSELIFDLCIWAESLGAKNFASLISTRLKEFLHVENAINLFCHSYMCYMKASKKWGDSNIWLYQHIANFIFFNADAIFLHNNSQLDFLSPESLIQFLSNNFLQMHEKKIFDFILGYIDSHSQLSLEMKQNLLLSVRYDNLSPLDTWFIMTHPLVENFLVKTGKIDFYQIAKNRMCPTEMHNLRPRFFVGHKTMQEGFGYCSLNYEGNRNTELHVKLDWHGLHLGFNYLQNQFLLDGKLPFPMLGWKSPEITIWLKEREVKGFISLKERNVTIKFNDKVNFKEVYISVQHSDGLKTEINLQAKFVDYLSVTSQEATYTASMDQQQYENFMEKYLNLNEFFIQVNLVV